MASADNIAYSADSGVDRQRTPEPPKIQGGDKSRTPGADKTVEADTEQSPPKSNLSHRFRDSLPELSEAKDAKGVSVMVSAPARPWEYKPFEGATTVETVLEEVPGPAGTSWYRIEFEDANEDTVSWTCLFFAHTMRFLFLKTINYGGTTGFQLHLFNLERNGIMANPRVEYGKVLSTPSLSRARFLRPMF